MRINQSSWQAHHCQATVLNEKTICDQDFLFDVLVGVIYQLVLLMEVTARAFYYDSLLFGIFS